MGMCGAAQHTCVNKAIARVVIFDTRGLSRLPQFREPGTKRGRVSSAASRISGYGQKKGGPKACFRQSCRVQEGAG
jgi:hypothetical protein